RQENLDPLPRRRRRIWGRELHLIVDRSKRLTPYRIDQNLFCNWISHMYPRETANIEVHCSETLATWSARSTRSDVCRMPNPESLVIVLGDLGSLGPTREALQLYWSELGERFRENGNLALALVPTALSAVPHKLRTVWKVLPWGTELAFPSRAPAGSLMEA